MSPPAEIKTSSPGAPGVPYYTPIQDPPAGTALLPEGASADAVPTLFTPLTIRGVKLANRFVVSPMCTFSADDGHLTDWHLVHLGQMAQRGAALTIVEATAVRPEGRISPEDAGLWADSHVAPLRRVADYVHAQNHKIGIQLVHAGRKASTLAPFVSGGGRGVAAAAVGGWPDGVLGASAIPFDASTARPHELTVDAIQAIVAAFGAAARRAVAAGIDVVEIHAAHGYLLSSFLSPQSNVRADRYGGSWENRTRILFEVIAAVRAQLPDATPLFVRLSATEWRESSGQPSWTIDDTVRVARLLPAVGVDLLDVSSGGNHADQQIPVSTHFQTNLAAHVRRALADDAAASKLLLGTVGLITTPELARAAVQKGGVPGFPTVEADLVLVGRQFLRQPEFVLWSARELGVPVQWPAQFRRAQWPAKF